MTSLRDFLDRLPRGETGAFASRLGISTVYLSQLAARQGGREPSPGLCVLIEQHTEGAVTRIDLRPNDWWQIWPELAERHPDRIPDRPAADEPEPERPGPNLPKSGNGPSPGMEPISGNEQEKATACGA